MPDVSRSDSQRSDSSQRPRVSFNRDVHVKRIGHPGTPRVVDALAGDGEGNLVPLTVRRERPTRLSRRELAKEAHKVLQQAGRVQCSSKSLGEDRNGFNTLPPIRSNHKHRRTNHLHARIRQESPTSSLDRRYKPRKPGPVLATLEREQRKKGQWSDQEHETSLNSNKTSSSLNDLLGNSSSSPDHFRKPRKPVTRSRSESGDRSSPLKRSKSGPNKSGFLSLDRLTLKRNKSKVENHSDRSPRPRKHILRKVHSDSESSSILAVPEHVQVETGRNKKQLSPIIEVTPPEDNFTSRKPGILKDDHNTSMHSSQVTPRPPLTRGQTVDQMVKRLSQDSKLSRGPPRGIASPTVVVAPGEERRHNNNLPFSYTEPTLAQSGKETLTPTPDKLPCTSSMAPTSPDGQVIYAEVVVSAGEGNGAALNKQTVHTKVSANKQCSAQPTHEDEGLGLTMERRKTNYTAQQTRSYGNLSLGVDDLDRNYSKDMNGYRARDYVENNGFPKSLVGSRIKKDSAKNYIQESSSKVVRDVRVDYGSGLDGSSSKKYVAQESSKFHSGSLDSSGRGRADGMDSRKKELEGYAKYEFGEKDVSSKRNLMDSFNRSDNYMTDRRSDSRVTTDQVDGSTYYDRKDPSIIQSRIDSHDLSSRRDRLESKIESQRKDRFNNSRINDSFKYNNGDSKINDNKKYLSDVPRMHSDASYNNRRDFLNSQLDYDKDLIKDEERYENQRSYATSNRYLESVTTEVDSYNKKDILADSGIEIDYRKDSTGMRGSFNKYDDDRQIKPKDGPTAKISINSNRHQQPHNVTRVDVNRRSRQNLSENEEDMDESSRYRYSANTKHGDSFVSTRLVQEQTRTVEAIPSSTVLIRHYAPSNKEDKHRSRNTDARDSDEEYQQEKNERVWKQAEREERDDKYREKRKEDDGDVTDDQNKTTEIKKTTKKKQVSTMDKMRQLFSRSDTKTLKKNKKKEEKKIKEEANLREQNKEPEKDALTSRYTEYKGSNVDSEKVSEPRNHKGGPINLDRPTPKPQHRSDPNERYDETIQSNHRSYQININDHNEIPRSHHRSYTADHVDDTHNRSSNRSSYQTRQSSDAEDHKESSPDELNRTRQRLATPTPSPNPQRAQHTTATLNRLNNSKNKENSGGGWFKSLDRLTKRNKNKAKIENIMEVTTEDEMRPAKQTMTNNNNNNNTNKNLRFFGDTDQESVASTRQRRYKSNGNRLQVPTRQGAGGGGLRNNHRHHRSVGDVATSSAESTTEGDSSQQSQKSVVYLHAATVGDIPGPARSRSAVGRRAQSREELSSAGSSHLQPQTKTVSRSISMLAPWKPRHRKEGTDVHYDNDKSNGKPPKIPPTHASGSSTVNRATRRRNAEKDKGRANKSASVESLSNINSKKQSTVNLSTSIESLSHKNGVKNQQKRDGRNASKMNSALNASAIELNSNKSYKLAGQKKGVETSKKSSSKLSRSASMPKDSRVTSGWFKLRNKKQVA